MREGSTFCSKLQSQLSTIKRRIIHLFTDPLDLFSAFYRKIIKIHAN